MQEKEVSPIARDKETSLFLGINEPVDPANLSNLEKQHIPVIQAPEVVQKNKSFEVAVDVGKAREHPNEYGHFIQFIDLYADDMFLARTNFIAIRTCPSIQLRIALFHHVEQLRAYACCNLHGTWVGRKTIRVEP